MVNRFFYKVNGSFQFADFIHRFFVMVFALPHCRVVFFIRFNLRLFICPTFYLVSQRVKSGIKNATMRI